MEQHEHRGLVRVKGGLGGSEDNLQFVFLFFVTSAEHFVL